MNDCRYTPGKQQPEKEKKKQNIYYTTTQIYMYIYEMQLPYIYIMQT